MPTAFRLLAPVLLLALASACSLQQARHAPGEPPVHRVLDAPPADWAALAGQEVRIAAPLAITGNHRLHEAGEVLASFDGRLAAPTEVALPGPAAAEVSAMNARRSLVLAVAEPGLGENAGRWRSGGLVDGATGVVELDDAGGARLRLTAEPRLQPAARPQVPVVRGDVRIASLNLQNLFNGDGRGGGFPTARGARTEAAYLAQQARLVATLRTLDPDIAALMELENDGYGPDSSVAQLVAALRADGVPWRMVDTAAGPGDNPIRVGMLYRSDRVAPVGQPAVLETGVFGALSRVPLAQAFRAGDGPAFTVVANHFKSKGCRDAAGPDRDQGDGQSCWNATRVESARLLDAWLRSDPTRSGTDLALVLGDLNAYSMEYPVRTLVHAGWRPALAAPAAASYTYVYDGQAGRLDHALLSPSLAGRLQGAAVWHSNADEAANAGDPDANAPPSRPLPWRSSDHDPVLVGLRLRGP